MAPGYNPLSLMGPSPFIVRDAKAADIPAMTTIYNQAVLNTVATMDTDPVSIERQATWFDRHGDRFPVLVAEADAGVIGWASLSRWMDRGAYAFTSEASVYVDESHRRHGVGSALLQALVKRAAELDYHVIIARIAASNLTSYRLVKSLAFEDVGTIRQVGYKFGCWIDVRVLQLLLPCVPTQ